MAGFASAIIIGFCVNMSMSYYSHDMGEGPVLSTHITTAFNESDSRFKILVLPLHPDQECTQVSTDYERQLIERFNNFKRNSNIDLTVSLDSNSICPTDSQAYNIGVERNADLVIWGYFDKDCGEPSKVRLRYHVIKEISELSENDKIGDSGYQTLTNLDDLRTGYLAQDIDNIIYACVGLLEYEERHWRNSLNHFNKIYKQGYSHEVAYKIWSNLYFLKEYDSALVMLNVIDSNRDITGENIARGDLYFHLGRYNEAIELANLGLVEDSLDFYSWLTKARSNYYLENYESSLEEFLIASELSPDGPGFMMIYWIGACYQVLGYEKDAIRELTKAIEQKPEYFESYFHRGLAYNDSNPELAVRDFTTYINSEPEGIKRTGIAYGTRGKTHFVLTNFTMAISDLSSAIKILGEDPITLYLRGASYYYLEDFDKALEDLNMSIKIDGNNAFAYTYRSQVFFYTKQYQIALADLEKALELDPSNSMALEGKQLILQKLNTVN